MKSFGFTQIVDSTDTTHQGFLSIYITHDRNKGYKPESKSTDIKSRGYHLPKAIVSGKELIRFSNKGSVG